MSSPAEHYSQFDISSEEKDNLVRIIIRYILFKTEQSGGCPIKREELTQLISSKNYKQKNLASYIINEAKSKLSTIFGYEMRELQRLRPSSANASQSQSSTTDAKSYIIISQLPNDVYGKHVEDLSKSHMTGFTFVAIAIVHLAGGKISEENLWHHLRRLGLTESEENHPLLGNIKLALEALVQQRYLQKDKVTGPDGVTLHYELAERSLDAAVHTKIKDYIAQIVQKDYTSVEVE